MFVRVSFPSDVSLFPKRTLVGSYNDVRKVRYTFIRQVAEWDVYLQINYYLPPGVYAREKTEGMNKRGDRLLLEA